MGHPGIRAVILQNNRNLNMQTSAPIKKIYISLPNCLKFLFLLTNILLFDKKGTLKRDTKVKKKKIVVTD